VAFKYGYLRITNRKPGEIIQGLLATDAGLGFMMRLDKAEIDTLVACIQDRVVTGRKMTFKD